MPDINSQGDVTIGGDVVGRDKIVKNIQNTTTNTTDQSKITVGNITGSTGVAIGPNAQAHVTQGGPAQMQLAVVFAPILEKVQALPDGPAKTMAEQAAQGLKAEAEKGEAANEKKAGDWLGFLAQMAPDAWDVAVAAFASPIAGVSAIFQKIAARARAEKDAQQAADPGK